MQPKAENDINVYVVVTMSGKPEDGPSATPKHFERQSAADGFNNEQLAPKHLWVIYLAF